MGKAKHGSKAVKTEQRVSRAKVRVDPIAMETVVSGGVWAARGYCQGRWKLLFQGRCGSARGTSTFLVHEPSQRCSMH